MAELPPEEAHRPVVKKRKRPGVKQQATHLQRFFMETIWLANLAAMPRWKALLYRVARVLSLAGRGYFRDEVPFRASALTYTTVLSLVPVLAFGFAIAKGLKFDEKLRTETIDPFLDNTFGPEEQGPAPAPGSAAAEAAGEAAADAESTGPKGVRDVIVKILDFVKNADVTALGAIGALILVYTILQLLGTIERSFNDIWGVERQRRFIRKIADYLTMVVITPIFLFTATTLTAAAQSNAFVTFLSEDLKLEVVIKLLLRLAPLVSMWIGFTFLYMVMPNTRTKLSSALIGGVVGGSLWQLAQVAHVKFQIGVANYSALYSTFAAFPIFLVWLYLSWVIVLVGAELAAAHQNEALHERTVRTQAPPHVIKEILALRALKRIGEAFVAGRKPWTASTLSDRLGFPQPIIEQVMGRLTEAGLVAATGEERNAGYVPAQELDAVTVKQALDALKGGECKIEFPPDERADFRAESVLRGIDDSVERSEWNLTLRQLIAEGKDKGARTLPPSPPPRRTERPDEAKKLRRTATAEVKEAEEAEEKERS